MKRSHKFGIMAAAALLASVGGGYGLWTAWDTGLIGANPRAPVAAAMESAVRKQVVANTMSRDSGEVCMPLELNRPQPEATGFPGIAMDSAPGRYSITLLQQTNFRDQPNRDNQLSQLDYLASQGLFSAQDSTIVTDDGPRPARNYQMTWAGFSAIKPNHGSSLCLSYGRREFVGIETIEKLLEKVLELDVYEATYVSRVADVPAWASTVEARNLFPKLPQLIAENRGKAKVIRAKGGWRSAYEVETEIAQTAKGSANNRNFLQMETAGRAIPTLGEAQDLLKAQPGNVSSNWAAQFGMACMPLNIQRGGDDKTSSETGLDPKAPYTVTYYDRADRKKYEYRTIAKALHSLSALEGAGLAQMEQLKAPPLPKGLEKKGVSPVTASYNSGVRFYVSREAVEALGMSGNGGGCVPAGRLKAEVVAVHGNNRFVQIAARGHIEQTPAWAAKIGERLPALQSIIETGLPLSGQMAFTTDEGTGKWRLTGLSPNYPETSYNSIPARLAPLMPLTAAAFAAQSVKAVKAPALVRQQDFVPPPRPRAAVGSPAQPLAVQAAPRDVTGVNAQQSIPTATAQPVSSQPPYPANNAPVHVVSIYQGFLPGGEKRGFGQHPEGVVQLTVSEPDAVLLLFAYEPVEWRIKAAKGVALKRVIATGYYEQRVTFEGGGKPQVVATRDRGTLQQLGVELSNGFPTGHDANDLVDIAAISRALTGAVPRSYQGRYDITAAGIAIGPQTPHFTLPERQAPHSATAVKLVGDAVEGNRLLRGTAGAYTDAWSNQAYSAGKVYFEGRMRVTGALAAHTHANIGVCLARGEGVESSTPGETMIIRHGEQKLYKDGDIVGIAADFEQQRLYCRVNGAWVTGAPGSGNGMPLAKGKEYRACLWSAGTVSGEVKRGIARSDTTWEVNFGDQPFSQAIPPGYVSFQGK